MSDRTRRIGPVQMAASSYDYEYIQSRNHSAPRRGGRPVPALAPTGPGGGESDAMADTLDLERRGVHPSTTDMWRPFGWIGIPTAISLLVSKVSDWLLLPGLVADIAPTITALAGLVGAFALLVNSIVSAYNVISARTARKQAAKRAPRKPKAPTQ